MFVAKTPDYNGGATENRKALDSIPNVGQVYDYQLDKDKCKWKPWIGKGGGSVETGITQSVHFCCIHQNQVEYMYGHRRNKPVVTLE